MEHIGIDLGASQSHVVVLSENQLSRHRMSTSELGEWLSERRPSRIVMETCTQSVAVARRAKAAGHHVVVVPGKFVRMLGIGARGIKTDDRDAEALARASMLQVELPNVHLRSEQSYSRAELLSARSALVKSRKAISNQVKSWLRGRLIHLKVRASGHSFCEAVRIVALQQSDGLPLAVETLLQTYAHLCTQLEQLEQQIQQIAEHENACTTLMSIPGVGPVVALSFVSRIDDPHRFRDADHLASFLALVPGEASTGGRTVRLGIIHAGPSDLKALLVQAAWAMWRCRPNDPVVVWARSLADKRGKRIAIIALARKLATIMWSMWKLNCAYDPTRAARSTPTRLAS